MARSVWELTAAVASGDREAFAEFYRDWFEPVLNHAQRISHADESFCLDATQEVFMRVIRSMPAMERRSDVERWLIRVVRSCVVDGLRWALQQKRREQAAAGREASAAESGRLEAQEKIAWLEAELAGLQAPQRELIDMRFRLGWTLQRIGQALGLNPGAVDGRISRIIRGLQRRAGRLFTMNNDQPQNSPSASGPREAMLPDLLDYMDRVHAARRTRRRVFVGVSATAMLMLVVTMIIPHQPSAAPPTIAQPTVERMPDPETTNIQSWLVTTQPGIAERYAIETDSMATRIEQVGNAPKFVEYLTDDRLLRVLADFGRPTGLIRMKEKVLLTAVVTDPEPAAAGTGLPSSS